MSRAAFIDCIFQNNNGQFNFNGGAIDVWPWFSLDLVDSQFINNTAHTGGAINAVDCRVWLRGSSFVNNTVCGAWEGPAIFLGANNFPPAEHVAVNCVGDGNIFVDNLDGVCIENYEQPVEDIMAVRSIDCGDVAG